MKVGERGWSTAWGGGEERAVGVANTHQRGCSSVVECSPSTLGGLKINPSTSNKTNKGQLGPGNTGQMTSVLGTFQKGQVFWASLVLRQQGDWSLP